jgi:hypothetical protein
MKKSWISRVMLGVMAGFLSVFSMNLVSATWGENVTKALDEFTEGLNPILKWVLGTSDTGELLLIKLLVFILMIAMALIAVSKVEIFEERTAIKWIIVIIIGVLGARFLTTAALVNFVWLPYGILGILLASILPFIIYFYFIESFDSPVVRKVGWVAFGVIYFVLGLSRWDQLAWSSVKVHELNTFLFGILKWTTTEHVWWQNFGWIYVLIAIFSIIAILADRRIRGVYLMGLMSKTMSEQNKRRASQIVTEINYLESRLPHAADDAARTAIMNNIKAQREALAAILQQG